MILDTHALSAMAEGNPALEAVLPPPAEQFLPVVVLGEYLYGIARSRYGAPLRRWLAAVEAERPVLTLTRETAERYARVRERLRAAGSPIPENDLWIAALALEHGLTLLSRDEHFDRVEGLRRRAW